MSLLSFAMVFFQMVLSSAVYSMQVTSPYPLHMYIIVGNPHQTRQVLAWQFQDPAQTVRDPKQT